MTITPWAHQVRGVEGVMAAVRGGHRAITLSSPTGMGKTWMVERLAELFLEESKRVLILTSRRVLLEQLRRDMESHTFGVRAAGYLGEPHLPFQIGSFQTDRARLGKPGWDFRPGLVVIDEGHAHANGTEDRKVIDHYLSLGAVVVFVTATPVGMGRVSTVIVQAGTNKEGRQCGALLQARHFAPDEPALASLPKKLRGLGAELTEEDARRAVMRPGVFGRVVKWWEKLNPRRKATILFACGVPESRWFARQFFEAGYSAASIDSEEVWINGEKLESNDDTREEVRRGSEHGEIQVVSNRFVLREGSNWPWLAHGIMATVFDSLSSYLQAGGRLLRSHPDLRTVCVQDHGGNWLRHGSLNDDREWLLDLDDRHYGNLREDGYRKEKDQEPGEVEPTTCPRCRAVLRRSPCWECGFAFPEGAREREVIQVDGTPVRITKPMFPPHATRVEGDTLKKWKSVYFRMRKAREPKTFRQAVGFFVHEYGYRPPRDMPYMPTDKYDWDRHVKTVPFQRLVPDPGAGNGTRKKTTKTAKSPEKGLFDE